MKQICVIHTTLLLNWYMFSIFTIYTLYNLPVFYFISHVVIFLNPTALCQVKPLLNKFYVMKFKICIIHYLCLSHPPTIAIRTAKRLLQTFVTNSYSLLQFACRMGKQCSPCLLYTSRCV